MSFQKAVTISGIDTIFALEEKSIFIENEEQSINLRFDKCLSVEERKEICSALASPNFISLGDFLEDFGVIEENVGFSENFTKESYDFMNYLYKLGLPLDVAAITAFLTDFDFSSTSLENSLFQHRKQAFENFMLQAHTMNVVQLGLYSGITTFVPYYLILQRGGEALASRASFRAKDDPRELLKLIEPLARYGSYNIAKDISEIQFNVLIDFFTEGVSGSNLEEIQKLTQFLIELTLSNFDLTLAYNYDAERLYNSQAELDRELLALLRHTIFSEGHGRMARAPSTQSIIAILKSKYSKKALAGAFKVLELNALSIESANAEYFIAFVAIADYLSTGGTITDSIDWMVSMEPSLDKKRFFLHV